MRWIILAPIVLLSWACSSSSDSGAQKKIAVPVKPAFPQPVEEAKRFPKANQVELRVVDHNLFGKDFLPGGTLAQYSRGKVKYQLFLGRAGSPNAAAIALGDWKNQMNGAKFVASFGGYFGSDGGKPVFAFTKGDAILGVVGLDQAEADTVAREFAAKVF